MLPVCNSYIIYIYIYIYIYFYNINHKQILTKYYNHQEHTHSYLGGYKKQCLNKKPAGTNYQNENTKGEKEDKNNLIVKTKEQNKINNKKSKKLNLFHSDNFALT